MAPGAPPGLLVARRALFQGVEAPPAQRRAVVRRGGREHCVQENEHEHAQFESAVAQSGCCGHREGRPGTGAAGPQRPSGGLARALFSPDITALGVIGG